MLAGDGCAAPPSAGFGVGVAPGFGVADSAGLLGAGALGADSLAAALAAAGLGAAGLVSAGFGVAAPDAAPGLGAPGTGALGVAVLFGAAFLGAAASAGFWAGMASFSLRMTGGSRVDDGPLTNSPMSLSFARSSLLVRPSSLATSCTRGFATILLSQACTRAWEQALLLTSHFEPFIMRPSADQPVLSEEMHARRSTCLSHLSASARSGRPANSRVCLCPVGLDVDLGTSELGRQASVLPFFADRQGELRLGHECAHCLELFADHLGASHLGR